MVVLTGGIGTGKSTVARMLGELGAEIIEADRLGHEVLEPGGAAFGAVARRWPQVVAEGRIDRRALAKIVFDDRTGLRELEELTHPAIRRLIANRVAASEADVVVLEIPIPAKWLNPSWRRVVVDADESIRRSRLLDRGMTSDEVDARMAVQPSRAEWQQLADHLVLNDGDLPNLAGEVGQAWQRIRRESSPEG